MKTLFALALACLVLIPGAQAQTTPGSTSNTASSSAADDQDEGAQPAGREPVDEVMITGSRIVRDGTTAPTPVTVIGDEFLENRASINVADTLNELPMFRLSQTNQSQSSQVNRTGVNFLNLRGLGTSRTLVLVDGMRFVPTGDLGELDLNLIPAIMINKVDVVTGGASASYGSDAVAGVVNMILKDDVDYTKIDVQVGSSKYGDNETIRGALLTGTNFANDRGNVTLGLEWYNNDGIGDMYERPWGKKEYGLIVNPSPAVNGLPLRFIERDVRNATIYPNGLITAGPLRGTKFLADGTPAPFQYGEMVGTQYMIGGEGYGERWHRDQWYGSELERRIIYLKTTFDITDNVELYVDANYGWKDAKTSVAAGFNFGNITIQRSNAFLHPDIAARMDQAGVETFLMGRAWFDVGANLPYQKDEVMRVVAGLTGDLGDAWTWDVNMEYGENDQDHGIRNAFNIVRATQALDAVAGPNGDIVCRSTLTDPGNGCVPFNVFGYDRSSDEAYAWIRGHQYQEVVTKQTHATANITGQPFELWAGPLSVAAGIEYRKEELEADADALGIANNFQFGNYKPLEGSYDTNEIYLEAETPLVQGAAFADNISLNGAVRYTDYSTSGGVTTWKMGLTWEVNDQVRLRATRSRDIRAPGIPELFAPARAGSPTLILDPLQDNAFYFTSTTITGNAALAPEEADTFTGGIVFQPNWFAGSYFSVDYFDIDLQDAISTITVQDMVTRCANGETSLCSFITRDASGRVVNVAQTNVNVAQFTTRGVDLEFGYTTGLNNGADLTARLFATRVLEQEQSDGIRVTELLGQYTNPKLVMSGAVTYAQGPFSTTLHGRYDEGGNFNNLWVEGVDIADNDIGSVFYLNLSAEYSFGEAADGQAQWQLYAIINNLLDEQPQNTPQQIFVVNPFIYDMIGQWYGLGLRAEF